MECGTREETELLFATGVQQDFPLGEWLMRPALLRSCKMQLSLFETVIIGPSTKARTPAPAWRSLPSSLS